VSSTVTKMPSGRVITLLLLMKVIASELQVAHGDIRGVL
jgi:hypothetical protein